MRETFSNSGVKWIGFIALKCYTMIVSFKHKGLKKLYQRGDKSGLTPHMVPRIEEILTVLNASEKPDEADLPGYRLHTLTGDLQGL